MKKIEVLIVATISAFVSHVAFAEIDAGCKQLWDATSAAQTCKLSNLTKYEAGGAAICTIEATCLASSTHREIENRINSREINDTVYNKESVSVYTILETGLNNCNGKLTYNPC
ncbi:MULTISPECIES: hypothetical protein [unclassified Pseudomonas]|uniref:hypothetical protein n=1 Tax=unclassified Pseudomonas TaxID=196821 RepID=UPI0030D75DE8